MPSRCALPRTAVSVRPILRLITPVGVMFLASRRIAFTSSLDHGSRRLRLYFELVLRGHFLPIGEPGCCHAALRTVFAIPDLLSIIAVLKRANQTPCRRDRFHPSLMTSNRGIW
jgi:hypothetical protein